MAKVVELYASDAEPLYQLEDHGEQMVTDAGELVVDPTSDGVLNGRRRDVLVRLADEPLPVAPPEIPVSRRIVGDVVVAVHTHGREDVDACLVELPVYLCQRPTTGINEVLEILLHPVLPVVLEDLEAVPGPFAYLRLELVGLRVADAPADGVDR